MCNSIVECMGWGDVEDAPLLYTLITMVYIKLEDAPLYLCGNERLLSLIVMHLTNIISINILCSGS